MDTNDVRNPRRRRIYVAQRLKELSEERARLVEENARIKQRLDAQKQTSAPRK
jgi:hypothetical protein